MNQRLWAGSESSFDIVLEAQQRVEEGFKSGHFKAGVSMDSPDFPPIAEVQGNKAIINIDGPLVDGSAGFMRYFGVLGYDDIAKAAIDAYSNPDVKAVLWEVNSPGGDVNGVTDMAKLVSQLSATKPSATHTSNLMASAGYWVGSSVVGPISSGPVAIVGSIGVLTVHREYSQQLAQDGINATILRAGKNKALTNPIEPLTPEAISQTQSKLDDVHAMFKSAVAANRPGMSASDIAATTDGSEFMGKRAMDAGLVDKIQTLSEALKSLDKAISVPNNPSKSKGKAMKISITPEQLAAIKAGTVDLETLGVTVASVVPEAPAPSPAAAPATPTVVASVSDDVVSLLKAQLSTAQAQAVATAAELLNLKAANQTQQATHDALVAIARDAVGRMVVPLGGTEAAVQGMDAQALVTEHARVSPLFLEKFRVGGVATSVAAPEGNAKPDPAKSEFLTRLGVTQTK